uniref:Uncharacterized protein n=1 Tax=Romanomermis culicivorax TaxID=13658 RepID=A0A915IGF8_ROMCU
MANKTILENDLPVFSKLLCFCPFLHNFCDHKVHNFIKTSGSSGQKLFCVDLTRALVESGIPIFKTGAIETLETRNFKKEEQWKIFMEAGEMLTGFAREKFDASLRKNPDIKRFVENNDPEFRLKTLYAPLVSVEVERGGGAYLPGKAPAFLDVVILRFVRRCIVVCTPIMAPRLFFARKSIH